MPRTPENITRHELIGLPIRVADAPNVDLVDTSGRVVGETMNTIIVSTDSGDKQVAKKGSTFEVELSAATGDDYSVGSTNEAAEVGAGDHSASDSQTGGRKDLGSSFKLGQETTGVRPCKSWPSGCSANPVGQGGCEDGVYVTVDGSRLLSRPADRTQRTGDSKWR